jgi:hypothetical protein
MNRNSVHTLISRFDEQFSSWGIVFPSDDSSVPERGKIIERGWTVWFAFIETDDDICLDYYCSHRMTDDCHVRLHADGCTENLPAISSIRLSSKDPEEDKQLAAKFAADNREAARLLAEKGFVLEGDEPGHIAMNRALIFEEDEGVDS